MSKERIHELAVRYRDDQLTDAELRELELALKNDDDSVREFVDIVRLDDELATLMSSSLPPRPQVAGVPRHSGPNRRAWLQWMVGGMGLGKGAVAAGLGGLAGAWGAKASDAAELRELRGELTQLQEFRVQLRRLLASYRLAFDSDHAPGPAVAVTGPWTVAVAGFVDPGLIRSIRVNWDADVHPDQWETVYSSAEKPTQSFATFSHPHEYALQSARTYRVVIQAIPREDAADALRDLGRTANWLHREGRLVVTSSGLAVSGSNLISCDITPGETLRGDWLRLNGVAAKTGMFGAVMKSPDGRCFLISPRSPVESSVPFHLPPFDLAPYPNGSAEVVLLWSPSTETGWPQELTGSPGSELPPQVIEAPSLPKTVVVMPRPVEISLVSQELMAARWVLSMGGKVQPYQADWTSNEHAIPGGNLFLQGVHLANLPIRDLTPLRHLRQLQSLQLAATAVVDPSLHDLARRHPQLTWVELGSTAITDESVVRDLCQCRHLTSLNLAHNPRITDVSVRAIASQLPRLEHLNLSYTAVTSVEPLLKHPALRKLSVTSTAVPPSQIEALRAATPDLQLLP